MLWRSKRKLSAKRRDFTAVIDEGSEIEGKYSFSGTVMLNAKFTGEIVSADTLIIGQKAVVNGNVQAGAVVVNGQVVGNISATERVELKGAARVFGDVETPILVIEEGVLFEGRCRMTKPAPVETARDLSVVALKR
jgi:cytoskeletal protein CcmA (bactofilin family)